MRRLIAVSILLAIASPVCAETSFPAGSDPADVTLLAYCRLFLVHPDLRTPALRQQIEDAFRKRQTKWAGSDSKQAAERDVDRDAREATRIACGWALGPAASSKTNSVSSNTDSSIVTTIATTINGLATERAARDSTPEIEPWPPPTPTDQATFAVDTEKFKTVGDLSDSLMRRLNGAGIFAVLGSAGWRSNSRAHRAD